MWQMLARGSGKADYRPRYATGLFDLGMKETALAWFYGKLLSAALCGTRAGKGCFSPKKTGGKPA
jgi:hypothetical protein